ncbi:hypothetical protein SAMN04487820_102399 [Actinopolyspora mzabensis]|uniref:Uncharacterized protein n=1 Tax=Actinopolyspora mzabensis TaxID=995066 RepID=A0A1G8X5H8_ACTMZ|nr:hypothetical protein [Actinopolyspora mzabensis]SDJ85879.1 hypothetical protein SAMN04487820_102399 [Actinopolyspora mzabensis]
MVLSSEFSSLNQKSAKAIEETEVAEDTEVTEEAEDVRLIPTPRLEWSLATESNQPEGEAGSPESMRTGWVHTASQDQVLDLFRRLGGPDGRLPAPWWLHALHRGEIGTRAEAFRFEDDLHALLITRPGWVFVPWSTAGEIGYWEYGPSDRPPMSVPTTVTLTDQHPGWINIVPAQTEGAPTPRVPAPGVSELAAILPRIEAW